MARLGRSAPTTPPKLEWLRNGNQVNDALEVLSEKIGVKLPHRNELESPEKRKKSPAHLIKQRFSALYYLNRDVLVQEVADFLEWLPSGAVKTDEEKASLLLNRLNLAYSATPKRQTRSANRFPAKNVTSEAPKLYPIPTESAPNLQDAVEFVQAPASPTMAIKHMPPGSQQAPLEGPTSNNTSFATSFWSEAANGSQQPASPATSVGSFVGGTDGTNERLESPSKTSEDMLSSVTTRSTRKRRREEELPSTSQMLPPISSFTEAVKSRTGRGLSSSQFSASTSLLNGMNDVDVDNDMAMHSPQRVDSHNQLSHQDESSTSRPSATFEQDPDVLDPDFQRHRVEKIPYHGLSMLQLPVSLRTLGLVLQWEAYRVLQTGTISQAELEEAWTEPRSLASLHALVRLKGIRFQKSIESTDLRGVTLNGKLRWRKSKTGTVFYLELMPLKKETKSNSFQREFGHARFLYIDVPSLYQPPESTGIHTLQDRGQIGRSFRDMLDASHPFLGRNWRQFHVKDKEPKNDDPDFAVNSHQLTFFAVSGCAIEEISLSTMLDWAVPFNANADESSCKAYARLDLCASRTISTLAVERSKIHIVEDRLPDDTPDDSTFNDPNLDFGKSAHKSKEPIDDGCNRISNYAMKKVAEMLGLVDIPSTIQARVFGAKGIWVSDDNESAEEPPEHLIDISRSQWKVKQPDQEHSIEKRTINVNGHSSPALPSAVFTDQLPILIDRGVPRENIEEVVRRFADSLHQELLFSLQDPLHFHDWLFRLKAQRTRGDEEQELEELAGMPKSREERLLKLLEAGFDLKDEYVAREVKGVVKQLIALDNKNIRIGIPRSTMLTGIADPMECLAPGEIHVVFSKGFQDSVTKDSWMGFFKTTSALIGRLPALGQADIQRVRLVFKPQLAHIKDTFVLSAKGPCSLASKLQGGDYDGDRFWVCWDQLLALPFKNAPVPDPDKYTMDNLGITKSRVNVPLGQALSTSSSSIRLPSDELVRKWIKDNTKNRMGMKMLHKIALAYDKVRYHENGLNSPVAEMLLALHGHMIDADKRGLYLDNKEFQDFLKRTGISELKAPAHHRYTRPTISLQDDLANPKQESIQDHVFFKILESKVAHTLRALEEALPGIVSIDADLTKLYYEAKNRCDEHIQHELDALVPRFEKLRSLWKDSMASFNNKAKDTSWQECIELCRQEYLDIQPTEPNWFVAKGWLHINGDEPSLWEKLKASTLAALQHEKGSMIFNVAGNELCWLKAPAGGQSRVMGSRAYLRMKPIRRKQVIEHPDAEEGEAT